MISFIICSISPERVQALRSNIRETIGRMEYELIVFDNRKHSYGIAKVYNLCAEKARYANLCFLHEDVAFCSEEWGSKIESKLEEKDCGIIGFTGSPIKFRSLSSVHPSARLMVNHYIQQTHEGKELFMNSFSDKDNEGKDYAPCITIDGMCLFMRKEVWEKHRFDEQLLPGFHGYDLDISLQVAEHYKNYVCGVVTLKHFSVGSFSTEWVTATIRLHEKKWDGRLPLCIDGFSLEEVEKWEEDAFYRFIKKVLRTDYPYFKAYKLVKQYWKKTHFRKHSLTLLIKLIGTRFLHLKI